MGMRLITGPVGSGKTRQAVREFTRRLQEDPGAGVSALRYVVPTTRMARCVQQWIMEETGLSGVLGSIVCSFYQFADEIIGQSGFSGSMISDTQRLLLLKDLVLNTDLEYFRRSAEYPGFIEALGEIIGELKLAQVEPDHLLNALQSSELSTASSIKIRELIALYRKYQKDVLEGNLIHDREGLMWRSVEILKDLRKKDRLHFRHVVFDSLDELSGVQREFLQVISECTDDLTVILNYEPERPEVFGPVESTRQYLIGMGAEEESRTRIPVDVTGLVHLERNVFCPQPCGLTPDDTVVLLEGGSPMIEVELIAEEICKLVRDREYAFGEIALIGRDIRSYTARIESIFPEYGIPFPPQELRLAGTAMARLLIACLNVVRDGWKRTDVIRVLKSGLMGDNLEEACSVEVEARQLGIFDGRSRWLTPWHKDDAAVELRNRILQPLVEFESAIISGASLKDYADAIRRLVDQFRWRKSHEEQLAEDASAHQAILDILDELVRTERLLGSGFDLGEFIELLRTALYSAKLRERRPAGDFVQILSASQVGGQKFRAVFVLGLLEKVFPRQISEDSFLRDFERMKFNPHFRNPLKLADEEQGAERLAFYTAISSATEKLFLCYPLADETAKDSLPSFYLDEVAAVFGAPLKKERRDVTDLVTPLSSAQSRLILMRSLSYALVQPVIEGNSIPGDVYVSLSEDDLTMLKAVMARRKEKDAAVECDDLMAHLSRKNKVFSCSELEAYAACPFMHFSAYTLRLEPLRDEVSSLDMGIILHDTLHDLYSGLRGEYGSTLSPQKVDIDQLIMLGEGILRGHFESAPRLDNLPAHERDLLRQTLLTHLKRYLRGEHRGDYQGFVPTYFELQFGKTSQDYGKDPNSTDEMLVLTYDGGDKVFINGKMDRVDVRGREALVIDYKTGTSTSIKDFEKGLVLQAMVYAIAIRGLFGLDPVGTEYRLISKCDSRGYYVEGCGIGKRNSQLPAEDFSRKLDDCKGFVKSIVAELAQGVIKVYPKDCKDYCPYRPICRIDGHKLLAIKEKLAAASAEQEEVAQ